MFMNKWGLVLGYNRRVRTNILGGVTGGLFEQRVSLLSLKSYSFKVASNNANFLNLKCILQANCWYSTTWVWSCARCKGSVCHS